MSTNSDAPGPHLQPCTYCARHPGPSAGFDGHTWRAFVRHGDTVTVCPDCTEDGRDEDDPPRQCARCHRPISPDEGAVLAGDFVGAECMTAGELDRLADLARRGHVASWWDTSDT